jgi:hypothetical protein
VLWWCHSGVIIENYSALTVLRLCKDYHSAMMVLNNETKVLSLNIMLLSWCYYRTIWCYNYVGIGGHSAITVLSWRYHM